MGVPDLPFEAIFHALPDAIWVCDLDTLRIIAANETASELYGYTLAEFLQLQATDLLPIEDIRTSLASIELHHALHHPQVQARRRRDGSIVWVEVTAKVADTAEQRLRIVSCRDVTAHREADAHLKESEVRFRAALDGMSDGVLLASPLEEVLYVNSRFAEITGLRSEDVIGKQTASLGCLQSNSESLFGVSSQSPTHGFFHRSETHLTRLDGTTTWVEILSTLLRDESGDVAGILYTFVAINDRKLAEDRLAESEQRYRSLFDHNLDAVFSTDLHGHIVSANPACAELVGTTIEEFLDTSLLPFLSTEDEGRARQALESAAHGKQQSIDATITCCDRRTAYVTINFLPIRVHGQLEGVYAVIRDITERREALELIRRQAYHDTLTDLPNRLLFNDRLTHALARSRRSARLLAVLFLDLDGFKLVNDTLGHSAGDILLKQVADRLRACVRECDTLARMGGDEFTLLIPDIGTKDDVIPLLHRIREGVRSPYTIQGRKFYITTSVGISFYPGHGEDSEAIIRNADTALYRAKERGANQWELFEPEMNERSIERMTFEARLWHALECGEFEVHYQPQVSTRSNRIVGAEALARWNSPELGPIPPDRFIPVAEANGLIVPLGEWILRSACAQAHAWHAAGYSSLRVSVNLSARQFREPGFLSTVDFILSETGLDPRSLELEITENVVIQATDDTTQRLRELKKRGIRISIDDFGTGYSSLEYLRRCDISALKIDPCFVRDMFRESGRHADSAIISAIIGLAHALKLQVIAEGVETTDQADLLRSLQCDEIQGYLISRPLSSSEFEALLRHQR